MPIELILKENAAASVKTGCPGKESVHAHLLLSQACMASQLVKSRKAWDFVVRLRTSDLHPVSDLLQISRSCNSGARPPGNGSCKTLKSGAREKHLVGHLNLLSLSLVCRILVFSVQAQTNRSSLGMRPAERCKSRCQNWHVRHICVQSKILLRGCKQEK